jgi:hypothetical protein
MDAAIVIGCQGPGSMQLPGLTARVPPDIDKFTVQGKLLYAVITELAYVGMILMDDQAIGISKLTGLRPLRSKLKC